MGPPRPKAETNERETTRMMPPRILHQTTITLQTVRTKLLQLLLLLRRRHRNNKPSKPMCTFAMRTCIHFPNELLQKPWDFRP